MTRENGGPAVKLIPLAVAAEMLGVSVRWVRDHRTELPYYELPGGEHRVDERALVRWLQRQRPKPEEDK
jgi:hypothetical protein